uniref:Uncharacterized protein n=1 Tax=Theileria annulata TaxID=5874 RepID=A0A3B0N4C2_THEAN
MKNYNVNPYIPMGNWGTYHQKSCKGGNPPERGDGTTEQCDCSGSGDSNTSANPTLRVHNTTITNAGTLEAIATITVTKQGGLPHTSGPITSISKTTLSKADGELQIRTPLVVCEILNLTGTDASGDSDVRIDGTIIVTSPGTLGHNITLAGRLAGTLTLNNGGDNITVSKDDNAGLEANNPTNLTLQGINVTGVTGTATMEIRTSNPDHDLTAISGDVTITVTKLTKDNVQSLQSSGGELKRETNLKPNDTLNLEGTATATSSITNLKVSGKITIGGTDGTLGTTIGFTGDVTSSQNLTLDDAPDCVKVRGTNTLNLSPTKLDALKNTNFSLTSPDKHPLTYYLVTKSTITIGPNTTTTNVKFSGLSLVPVCITGTNAFKTTANLSLAHTQSNPTIKDPGGLTINLNNILSSAGVTITKDKVKSLPAGAQLGTSTPLAKGDTLTLKITPQGSGTTTTLEGKIHVTGPGKLTGNLTLSGGIEATISDLSGGAGTLEATDSVNITNLKYDPMEIHINHQSDSCVLVPLNYI